MCLDRECVGHAYEGEAAREIGIGGGGHKLGAVVSTEKAPAESAAPHERQFARQSSAATSKHSSGASYKLPRAAGCSSGRH